MIVVRGGTNLRICRRQQALSSIFHPASRTGVEADEIPRPIAIGDRSGLLAAR